MSTDLTSVCGYTVTDKDGIEGPCDRPAIGWRWYQDCEHEDLLEAACDWHENEGGRRMHAVEAEVQRLQRWKDEALPVIDGLQELGKALGIGLGQRITGPQALEAVERLQAERDDARVIARLAEESETGWRREAEELAVEVRRLTEGIEALADTWDAMRARNGRPMLTTANVVDRLRALLGGGVK